ncbi:hypothetical protein KSP39_PZI020495 [Platanthera zijinensis]|uniref:beta-glucosidase n=1 Tax=Platanthera zijinensis TaxID=2320716 RepID=A0AAP0B062_9ASPA
MGCSELQTVLVSTLMIIVPFEYNQFTQEPHRPNLRNCLYEQNRRCREKDPTTEIRSWEAVRKSLVLLKNGKSADEEMQPTCKILVVRTHADILVYQCGGWTIEWQGASGRIAAGTTILDVIKSTVDPATNVVFSENPNSNFVKEGDFSYVIVVFKETPYAEMHGNRINRTIQNLAQAPFRVSAKLLSVW